MSPGRGEEWGSETADPPDLEVCGGDTDLAAAVWAAGPGARVRFRPVPSSDLGRALGLVGPGTRLVARAVPMDVLGLAVRAGGTPEIDRYAVNAVVLGVAPDRLAPWHRSVPVEVSIDGGPAEAFRATTVAVLVGQYLRGADVSPRGHPGDGVCEVQIYGLPPAQRRAMRARLGSGTHLPHPAITTRRAQRVAIRCARPAALEVDGRATGRVAALDLSVIGARYSLLL